MDRTEKRRKYKEFAKQNKITVQEAKAHFETLSDNDINNLDLETKHMTSLQVFIKSLYDNGAIKTAMEPDANPVMSINEIGEVAGWFDLPKYQQDANEAWLKRVYDKLGQGGVWYYEAGDTLFVKKAHGFACIGGGLKEMGVVA